MNGMSRQLSEQEQIRRDNLQKIIDMGINPYPNETYPVTHSTKDINSNFKEGIQK